MSIEASEYAVDEANAELLASWLNAGQWTTEEATLLFQDIDPDREYGDRFSTFSGLGEVHYEYGDPDDPNTIVQYGVDQNDEPVYLTDEQDAVWDKAQRRCKKIERSLNLYESAQPHEWIELASEKGISIPWLDWAIARGLCIQKQEPDAESTAPVVEVTASESTQWHLLATPAELIATFGLSTGMTKAWFNALKDKPQLKASRHMAGVGGNRNREPLFNVFPVMQWLINPARRTGRPLGADKGWQLFESHFPRAYAEFSVGDPRTD